MTESYKQFQRLLNSPTVHLPVLDALLAQVDRLKTKKVLEKTLIYYVHHPLQTSINVIDSFVFLGAKYSNIFVLGKRYSECDEVVSMLINRGVHYQPCSMQMRLGQYATSFIRDINWLWFKVVQNLTPEIENVLILDHGGHAVTYVPLEILEYYNVVGIEKTSSGLFDLHEKGSPLFPLIDVANCLAKRHLESPLIAKAVVNKLLTNFPDFNTKHHHGIVGLGAIGDAITNRLISMGQKLIVFDVNLELTSQYIDHPQVICTNDINALVAGSDLIFGCSGRDITQTSLEQFILSARDKTLVSCSSEDKEFLSLLRFLDSQKLAVFDPLETIEYKSKLGASIRLLRGGFPANFDNSGESVPANEIQLTRALVVGAVLQAIEFFYDNDVLSNPKIYSLNMDVQRFIVSEWLKNRNNKAEQYIHDLFGD